MPLEETLRLFHSRNTLGQVSISAQRTAAFAEMGGPEDWRSGFEPLSSPERQKGRECSHCSKRGSTATTSSRGFSPRSSPVRCLRRQSSQNGCYWAGCPSRVLGTTSAGPPCSATSSSGPRRCSSSSLRSMPAHRCSSFRQPSRRCCSRPSSLRCSSSSRFGPTASSRRCWSGSSRRVGPRRPCATRSRSSRCWCASAFGRSRFC